MGAGSAIDAKIIVTIILFDWLLTLTLRERLSQCLGRGQAMKMYTVKDVARLSGISVRALHHYDQIGLLKPARVGRNRYRYYGEPELLRLQQILLYREFGVPLVEIIDFLDHPDFDVVSALETHKERVAAEAWRYRQLTGAIEATIARLKNGRPPEHGDLYAGFSANKRAVFDSWLLAERDEMRQYIDISRTRPPQTAPLPRAERERFWAEGAAVEEALADLMRAGQPSDSAFLDDLLTRHREWVAVLWARDCPPHAFGRLATLYRSHPDLRKRFDAIEVGFSDYLPAAMEAYAARRKS